VLGRAIADYVLRKHQDQQFHAGLLAAGKPPEIADAVTGFGKAIRENRFITRLGDTEQLIGRPSVDIATFL
jgi:hypothetical protein